MTGLMWSGTGRAVDAHLAAFTTVDDAVRRGGGERVEFWRRFSRAYSRTSLNDGLSLNGTIMANSSNADREDLAIALDDPRVIALADKFLAIERRLLDEGDTFYVSHPIIELVTNAARLAEPEPLFPTDLPTPHGLAVFEYPIEITDLHPDTGIADPRIVMPVRAIGWSSGDVGVPDGTGGMVAAPGVNLVLYTDMEAYRQVYVPALSKVYREDGMPDETEGMIPQPFRSPLVPIEFSPWALGSPWYDGGDDMSKLQGYDLNTGIVQIVSSVAYERRWTLALFRLMWQRILNPTIEPWDRATRRRADRTGIRTQRDVKVLKLRRLADDVDDPHDSDGRAWTMQHRVIVRGHWRRQYYRSLGAVGDPAAYRLVWIDPHIRGPESGPLIVKHNVTAVVR